MNEHDLREGADVWFPVTPTIAPGVTARLPALPDATAPRRSRRVLVIALAVLLLTGTALAATQLDLVPGVRVDRVDSLPVVPYAAPAFGRDVSLEEATLVVPFTVLLPGALGDPDRVLLDRDRSGESIVTAVWGASDGARLVLTQWSAESVLFEKLLTFDTSARYVDVEGASGIWIEGEEHAVFYRGPSGLDDRVGGYLTGNVLVWQRGPMSYRLEAAVSQERALELAASLRPTS